MVHKAGAVVKVQPPHLEGWELLPLGQEVPLKRVVEEGPWTSRLGEPPAWAPGDGVPSSL